MFLFLSASFSWNLSEEKLDQFYFDCWMGVRRYLLNDPDETIPKAARKMNRLILIDRVLKVGFALLVLYFVWQSSILHNLETQLVRYSR